MTKFINTGALPPLRKARLLITIVEGKPHKAQRLARYKGILKKKVDGLEYQKKMRSEWK
jgi:hypothetical protein